jgi:hypothetical protein
MICLLASIILAIINEEGVSTDTPSFVKFYTRIFGLKQLVASVLCN